MELPVTITLRDEDDLEMFRGYLRGHHSGLCDALTSCARAPHYPDWKRALPNEKQAAKIRKRLDRVEELMRELGGEPYGFWTDDTRVVSEARSSANTYYEREASIGRAHFAGI